MGESIYFIPHNMLAINLPYEQSLALRNLLFALC